MTDDRQQNLTDGKKRPPTAGSFKPGYDRRRWLKGRGKKSPEQREGEEILRAVIWEELSREFDARDGKAVDAEETVDALRMMVRSWMRKRPGEIADRIAGKVTDKVDVTSNGKGINEIVMNWTTNAGNRNSNTTRETDAGDTGTETP
jgi:hypothetical protein